MKHDTTLKISKQTMKDAIELYLKQVVFKDTMAFAVMAVKAESSPGYEVEPETLTVNLSEPTAEEPAT